MLDKAKFIKVEAAVRYWEDSEINGVSDEDGKLTPFRVGDLWCPLIEIESGKIQNWPIGTTAKFHFKVCDAGAYYLLDENEELVSSIEDDYVPNGLCHGGNGYGDYIIFNVDENGVIENYSNGIDEEDWSKD